MAIRTQERVISMICLSTDLDSGKPPIKINNANVPDDTVCEVCDTVTGKIEKLFKMNGGVWYEYTY